MRNLLEVARLSKGNQVNIPEPGAVDRLSGNVNELGDVGGSPGKSSLFFLTDSMTLESDYLEIGLDGWESSCTFCSVRCALDGP